MQTQIVMSRLPMKWSPIPYTGTTAPLIPKRPTLGSPSDAASTALIDSAMVSFITDLAAAVPSGLIAYAFMKADSKWSNFFWVLMGLAGFKAMVDLSRIRQK